jgi:hypothetical protein
MDHGDKTIDWPDEVVVTAVWHLTAVHSGEATIQNGRGWSTANSSTGTGVDRHHGIAQTHMWNGPVSKIFFA